MKRIVLTTAIILGLSVPALANDQLALSIGVEPSVFSTSQLAQLKAAQDDDDNRRFEFLLDRFSGNVTATQSVGLTPGHRQLTASINVDYNQYSLNEIIQIRSAIDDDDNTRVEFLLDHGDVIATQSFGVTPGHEQLARSLGVDAGEYSLSALARMKSARYDD